MDYIIINGKKSTTLNGLIITSLPPITKPKIRASFEEIDGVDGDIINKLGYGAYDKTFEIGLSCKMQEPMPSLLRKVPLVTTALPEMVRSPA